jgi:5-methyltetrahydrofolate--homocysteine methyltransferase
MTLLERIAAGVLVLDGAMGTRLQARGLAVGAPAELWVLRHPEEVEAVHREYVDAGAQAVFTNTFGANRPRLEACGIMPEPHEINARAVDLARRAARGRAFVAGSIGPAAVDAPFDALVEVFAEQASALVSAGVDAIAVETMYRPAELRAAVTAANACRGAVPLLASMTFDGAGRTPAGADAGEMLSALDGLAVDVVGANCCEGPESTLAAVAALARATRLPISAKPSAGLPTSGDPARYPATPSELAAYAPRLVAAGARLVGGCCGTTPEAIRSIAARLRGGD